MGGKCRKYRETYRFLVFFEKRRLVEGVGFEPTVGISHVGFQDRCIKPSSATPPLSGQFNGMITLFNFISVI